MLSLRFGPHDRSSRNATARRLASIKEALSWPSGIDVNHKVPTVVFDSDEYEVRLSKPGKEAAPEYSVRYKDGMRKNNPNDMRPEIAFKGTLVDKNASFKDVFYELENISDFSPAGLRVLAVLLARSAFMADHIEKTGGVWRYSPPKDALKSLCDLIPTVYDVPTEIFLHYIDALALNEDVKYSTLGYKISEGYGRRNNLLTCVHLISVLLKEVRISDFAGSMARPPAGVAPISQTKLLEIFTELS